MVEGDDNAAARVTLCINRHRLIYRPERGEVTTETANRPVGFESWSGFSLSSVQQDVFAAGLTTRFERLGDTVINGRTTDRFRLKQAIYPQIQVVVFVDRATNLPVRSEVYQTVGGTEKQAAVEEMRYDTLPENVFAPNFPKTVVFRDLSREKLTVSAYWHQRLLKPLAQTSIGSQTITIRDFQINEQGDAFTLFTTGRKPGEGNDENAVHLRDTEGGVYVRPLDTFRWGAVHAPVQPFIACGLEADQTVSGLSLHGEAVQGAYFVAVAAPNKPNRPRNYTFTYTGGEKPVSFSLAAPKTSAEYTPGYAPLLCRFNSNPPDFAIRSTDLTVRAAYAWRKERNLSKALKLYEAAEELDRRTFPAFQASDSDVLACRAEILLEMGRKAEARPLLEDAVKQPVYGRETLRQLEDALRRASSAP